MNHEDGGNGDDEEADDRQTETDRQTDRQMREHFACLACTTVTVHGEGGGHTRAATQGRSVKVSCHFLTFSSPPSNLLPNDSSSNSALWRAAAILTLCLSVCLPPAARHSSPLLVPWLCNLQQITDEKRKLGGGLGGGCLES